MARPSRRTLSSSGDQPAARNIDRDDGAPPPAPVAASTAEPTSASRLALLLFGIPLCLVVLLGVLSNKCGAG